MLSHAIPALISRTARRSLLPRVVIAFVISGIAFLPWVRMIYEYRTVIASGMDWAHKSIPITLYLEKLAFVASIPFFDLSFLDPRYGVISALVLGLVLVAGISIFRDRISLARFSYQLLMSLSLTTAGIFLVVDQLTHSFLATIGRYLTVSLLGEVLIVAWFIATNLHLRRRQMMGKSILAASLLLGIGCCLTANRSATWWDNHSDAQIPAIAEQIKQSSQALVIVEDPQLDHLLSLSHVLVSNVDFAIIPFDRHAAVSLAPQPIGNAVFLLDPSPELLARIHSDDCLQATPVVAAPQSFVENVHRQVVNTPGVDSPVLWKLAPVSPHRCELN
jgi:hypothetical protein